MVRGHSSAHEEPTERFESEEGSDSPVPEPIADVEGPGWRVLDVVGSGWRVPNVLCFVTLAKIPPLIAYVFRASLISTASSIDFSVNISGQIFCLQILFFSFENSCF